MRYQILMGTEEDLHHIGTGETLPGALLALIEEVIKDGDEEDLAHLNDGLESMEHSALVQALKNTEQAENN